MGPYITLSPVGSDGMHSPCDSDQPVADGPVGPSVTLGPVGPCGTLSQYNSDQPVGSSVELGLVVLRGMSLQIDINKVVTTDEPANSVGTSPSSDSGMHSLGEQWEDTSVVTTDAEEEQNRTSRIYTPTQRCVIDTCIPTNTEEDNVTLCPLIDCLSKQKSDESPEIDKLDNDRDSQWNETEEFYSGQKLTTDESSCEEYELWSNDLQHMSVMRDPVDPPGMSHLRRQNSVQQCEFSVDRNRRRELRYL